jgi:hypothetical protein
MENARNSIIIIIIIISSSSSSILMNILHINTYRNTVQQWKV